MSKVETRKSSVLMKQEALMRLVATTLPNITIVEIGRMRYVYDFDVLLCAFNTHLGILFIHKNQFSQRNFQAIKQCIDRGDEPSDLSLEGEKLVSNSLIIIEES